MYAKTVPGGLELTSDSAWALFQRLAAKEDAKFADTQPMATAAGLASDRAASKPLMPAGATLDEAMVVARRQNRVCPRPLHWVQLYDALGGCEARLPAPPEGEMWRQMSNLAKRMVLRGHLEWADANGKLEVALDFLNGLREDDWLHMGST